MLKCALLQLAVLILKDQNRSYLKNCQSRFSKLPSYPDFLLSEPTSVPIIQIIGALLYSNDCLVSCGIESIYFNLVVFSKLSLGYNSNSNVSILNRIC